MLANLLAAAETDPLKFDPTAYLTAVVVFLIAFSVLAFKVWPKILGALDARNAKILSEIEAAEKARRDADEAKARFERELAKAREDAQKMISDAKADAQRLADEIRARNEKDLAERLARANAEIDNAMRQAVSTLHAQAAELATVAAGKILGRQITAADQQKLIEESLKELSARRN
jgi:F-type H+-transporting ATPase subunit b